MKSKAKIINNFNRLQVKNRNQSKEISQSESLSLRFRKLKKK